MRTRQEPTDMNTALQEAVDELFALQEQIEKDRQKSLQVTQQVVNQQQEKTKANQEALQQALTLIKQYQTECVALKAQVTAFKLKEAFWVWLKDWLLLLSVGLLAVCMGIQGYLMQRIRVESIYLAELKQQIAEQQTKALFLKAKKVKTTSTG